MNITGNTILITGGTSGIGRGLAEALHAKGNRVIVTGRRQALLDEISKARPGIVGLPLDVDDPASLPRLVEKVRASHPELNVLIANAGIAKPEDLTIDPWDFATVEATIQTNIMGVLRVVAAFLPVLKRQPHSTVMATTSNLAFVPRADVPTYCASKAFLHSWLQSLRFQLRKTPVEVLELSPTLVQTELTNIGNELNPRGMPLADYIAEVMGYLETHNHPRGEIIVERGRDRRTAEREGKYEAAYATMNPA